MNTILTILMITVMTYEMPKLPYANNGLEPVISQQTIDYHYGKHLQTYVNNLNNLVPGTEFEGKDLVTIVATATGRCHLSTMQDEVLNHTLYFLQLAPNACPPSEPTGQAGRSHQTRLRQFREFQEGIQRGSSRTVRFGLGMAVC